jgi:putative transposase
MSVIRISKRRACRVLDQVRATQRLRPGQRDDAEALTGEIIRLTTRYGRYGYLRITAKLCREGWQVNHKRVERIWRQEELKVPQKQPKRGRLWFNDGSCVRLRPEHRNHVWSYGFVRGRTSNGRALRLLTVIDEYSGECLAIKVERRLSSVSVLECLGKLFLGHGVPEHIRSDNGPEFIAREVRGWLGSLDIKPLFIGGRAVPGRMVISNRSMASSEMSFWIGNCSIRSGRQRYWWKVGGENIIRSGRIALWAISHRHRRPCNPQSPGAMPRACTQFSTFEFSHN